MAEILTPSEQESKEIKDKAASSTVFSVKKAHFA